MCMCPFIFAGCDAYIFMNKNGSNYFNCVLNLLIDQCFVVDDGVAVFVRHFILFFNSKFQSDFLFASLQIK